MRAGCFCADINDGISAPPHPRGAGGVLRFWGERVLPLPRPLSREGRGEVLLTVTGCYKSAKEKGKVLPLFADKLNNEEIRPLEEA